MFFDVNQIVQAGGLLAIILILFAETGLLIGFFLPGDTLLIAAGVFASRGKLPLDLLIPAAALAAIVGYRVGYLIGERAGPRLFKRQDGLFFKLEHVERAEDFYRRHGGKTVVLARFIPVVRTIAPLVAGVGKMPKNTFFLYNVLGAFFWTTSIILAAYWIGNRIPNIDKYMIILVVIAMVVTTSGTLLEMLRTKNRRQAFLQALKEEMGYLFRRSKK